MGKLENISRPLDSIEEIKEISWHDNEDRSSYDLLFTPEELLAMKGYPTMDVDDEDSRRNGRRN